MRKTKGFIGPLGDDIPSIFPIIVGLVLFFGSMAYAVQRYDERTEYLDLKQKSLELSYLMTGKGFVENDTLKSFNFDELCATALNYSEKNGISCAITVQNAYLYGSSESLFKSNPGSMVSPPIHPAFKLCNNTHLDPNDPLTYPENYVSSTYPITIPLWQSPDPLHNAPIQLIEGEYQPGFINIVVWRRTI